MSPERYLPIPVAMLAPATAIGLDLYQIHDDAPCPVLFRGAAYPLERADLVKLRERGITCLYFSQDARGDYRSHLRRLAEGDGGTADVAMSARATALAEVVRDVFTTALESDQLDRIVAAARDLARLTTKVVMLREFNADELFAALHHDWSTATHSTNVAMYASVLATTLGLPKEDVSRVVCGALLHDLGRLTIPPGMLDKPGRLSDQELRIVRQHPLEGFRRLSNRSDVGFGEAMMVYQHHERSNGRGYPVGVVEEEIHPWARLCAVVDVFEATTSRRPHRKRLTWSEAIALLRRDAGTAYDPEMVTCWIAVIQNALKTSSERSSGRSACPPPGATSSPSAVSASPVQATSASTNG